MTGTCLPIFGSNVEGSESSSCTEDDDCSPGLRCLETSSSSSVNGGSELDIIELNSNSGGNGNGNGGSDNLGRHHYHHYHGARRSCMAPRMQMRKKQYSKSRLIRAAPLL